LAAGDSRSACAYVFPGQGCQHVGMGHDLCQAFPAARAVFAEADDILGMALSRLCFDGPPEVLNDTLNAQPAILTTSIAALRALEERGAEGPAYVSGHSLGEISALVGAGSLSLGDGLRLVRERGRLMKQAGERSPGGMAAVLGLGREDLEAACGVAREETGEHVGIANDNCPGQYVISGSLPSLQRATELAKARGARRVIRLKVSIAGHSPLMAGAAAEFAGFLDGITFREPAVPLVAISVAGPLVEPHRIRGALVRQLTSPVRWVESVRWMIAQGVVRFVELGPGEVLTRLLRRIDPAVGGLNTARVLWPPQQTT
jgi:[acyl-carrier-protein] S-malonyltransferase